MKFYLKNICFYCFVGMFLLGCSEQKIPTFNEVLPKEKLSFILIDMHIIDGTIHSHNNETRKKISLEKEYYDSVIFQKHGVSDSLFRASVQYYTIYGGIKDVFSMVLDSLNTVNAQLESVRQKKINANQQK